MRAQKLTSRGCRGRSNEPARGEEALEPLGQGPASRESCEDPLTPGARVRPGPTGSNATQGFTLIELMIVVVVVGILAAIGIPNYIAVQKRANEGSIKSNMHTLQMTVEDFGILSDGQYPTSELAIAPDGRTLPEVCPTGNYPPNPFTHLPSVVNFNVDPASGNRGELALNPALTTNYVVKGNGSDGTVLPLTLTSGQ